MSVDHEPVTSPYLPFSSSLNVKNLAPIRSPCGVNLIGWPRIDSGWFVFLICSRTFDRDGVSPFLHTAAMASSTTCMAAYTGGPNVPNEPNFDFALVTISASEGMLVMSGANEETYEPGI